MRKNFIKAKRDYKVNLERSKDGREDSLGFGIQGGTDYNWPIILSALDANGKAKTAGCRLGDQIIAINATSVEGKTHEEVAAMLQSHDDIEMQLRRPQHPQQRKVMFQWVDSNGRSCSPPRESPKHRNAGEVFCSDSNSPQLLTESTRKIFLSVRKNGKLGLSLRGGSEYGVGIYISGVQAESASSEAGLLVGDQVIQVNDQDFTSVTHYEAVRVLRRLRDGVLKVFNTGKLPYAKIIEGIDDSPLTSFSEKQTNSSSCDSSVALELDGFKYSALSEGARCDTPDAAQSIRNPATQSKDRTIESELTPLELEEKENDSLLFYLDRYREGIISLDGFISTVHTFLNDSQKSNMKGDNCSMGVARTNSFSWIPQIDTNNNILPQSQTSLFTRMTNKQNSNKSLESENLSLQYSCENDSPLCKSEISLDDSTNWQMKNAENLNARKLSRYNSERCCRHARYFRSRQESAGERNKSLERLQSTNKQIPAIPTAYDTSTPVDPQRDMDDSTQNLKRHSWCGEPHTSRSVNLEEGNKDCNEAFNTKNNKERRNTDQKAYIVNIPKIAPILGIAIEGGADSNCPFPVIVSIQRTGSAGIAGGLMVGDTILQVNGFPLDGLCHREVAMTMARAYRDPNKQHMQLLVINEYS